MGPLRRKSKGISIALAVFFSFWTWLYTYEHDRRKFWIALVISAAALMTSVILTALVGAAAQVMAGFVPFLASSLVLFLGLMWLGFVLLVYLPIWLWALTDTVSKSLDWYANYTEHPLRPAAIPANGAVSSARGKSKALAVVLALFGGFLTWLYTYKRNRRKFWIGLSINVALWLPAIAIILPAAIKTETGILGIFFASLTWLFFTWLVWLPIWLWALIDTFTKSGDWYSSYSD